MDPVKNEEEKRERILISKRKYARKSWYCDQCKVTIRIDHRSRHLKSDKHLSN